VERIALYATRRGLNSHRPVKVFEWNRDTILERMEQIDWYQFEKFCAALLQAEGYSVERKGGAQPDGGVDLVACKFDGNDTLIQCKHWRTWKVGEAVVRQMLGSMTDFEVKKGAIYSMKQWTQPAAAFAQKHNIELVDGQQLVTRAQATLSPATLEKILDDDTHH
jgi:restriction system protein